MKGHTQVRLADRQDPIYLTPRYAQMVALIIEKMEKMEEIKAGEFVLYWNGRDRRHTAASVGWRLTESCPAGASTENAAGGANIETKEAA